MCLAYLALLQLSAPALVAPGARMFVSNEDTGDVALMDAATHAVTATVPVERRPRRLRVSDDAKTPLVALSGPSKGRPGVDESKLPPKDRAADGNGPLDQPTTNAQQVRIAQKMLSQLRTLPGV